MTAEVIQLPHVGQRLQLQERVEDARREVEFCRADVRCQRATLQDAEKALAAAEHELRDLEEQATGALIRCRICGTYHVPPLRGECPEPAECPDCHQDRCAAGCPNRNEDPGEIE